jgi:hypothetical protein
MTKFKASWFHKKTAVKVIVFTKDKRVRVDYVKPLNNTLTAFKKTYTLNDSDWFLSDGFPTYVFNDLDSEPQNPLNPKVRSLMSADDFNVAISSKVARDIFEASNKGMDGGTLGLVLNILTLVGVAVVGYLTFDNFTVLSERITEIREILSLIGGL